MARSPQNLRLGTVARFGVVVLIKFFQTYRLEGALVKRTPFLLLLLMGVSGQDLLAANFERRWPKPYEDPDDASEYYRSGKGILFHGCFPSLEVFAAT
jgi:hypothetical protein